jgi:hypothetical protein
VSESYVWRRRISVDEVYRGAPGCVLMIRSGSPVYSVLARPWWDVPTWRAAAGV